MQRNIIIGQSGGPTAVINSSLAGVFKTARTGAPGKYTECATASTAFWNINM